MAWNAATPSPPARLPLRRAGGATSVKPAHHRGRPVTIEASYFSLASIAALVVFLAIMAPRALLHTAAAIIGRLTGRPAPVDRWLVAIAVFMLLCAGLAVGAGMFNTKAHSLLNQSESVTLSFLFFALPSVLQVARAWFNSRARHALGLSHVLVALAVLSLPAAMAIPTAALLQAQASPTGQPAAAPADNPAAAVVNERYFTDNEVANDPEDYPIATFLGRNLTWSQTFAPDPTLMGRNFYKDVPLFTGFWFDQTADVLTFEATDTFGALVSRITYVRANWAFSLAVFLYKLLCALVLVAVSFDAFIGPLAARFRRPAHRHPA